MDNYSGNNISQDDNDVEFNNRVPEEEEFNLEDLNLNISLQSSLSAGKY